MFYTLLYFTIIGGFGLYGLYCILQLPCPHARWLKAFGDISIYALRSVTRSLVLRTILGLAIGSFLVYISIGIVLWMPHLRVGPGLLGWLIGNGMALFCGASGLLALAQTIVLCCNLARKRGDTNEDTR